MFESLEENSTVKVAHESTKKNYQNDSKLKIILKIRLHVEIKDIIQQN